MKSYGRVLVGLITLCIGLNSCKLDKPVLPGEEGYIKNTDPATGIGTVTGTTITGTTINNSNLTALWKVATTTKQFYNQNNVVIASSLANNLFTSVLLSETGKTAG